ncbi:MAG TPA: ABC transporter substrate-binding protein [Bacteroidia bacterium]|nr:ABC transporter substrate-binding protein [Bacteroidia bacterium]
MRKSLCSIIAFLCACLVISSCSTYKNNPTQVVLWQLGDPGMLNPVLASDLGSEDIDNNIFQPLLNFDYRTLKLVPVLADTLPTVKIDSAGRMLITFEIRKEAKWDNGSPVTAKDVEFTLKVIKNPAVNDEALRSYYDMVSDIILYPDKPKKFTVVYNEKYMMAVIATGTDTYILPEYRYDSNKYMESFTVKQMYYDTSTAHNPKMIAFAKSFNADKYSRDTNYVSGSGAYQFKSWATGQRIVLMKKNNWWGDDLKTKNCFFEANPSKLIYQTINDMTSALVSLKAGNIDVIGNIKPSDFAELPKSEKFSQNFNTYRTLKLSYSYIGLNMANPKFADIRTRQAIAHLIDVPRIIRNVYYGYAQQVIGPVTPMDSLNYNYSIKPYSFNIDTARALLAAAGWKDSDGDGILDKKIDGKKTDFIIDYLCNAGNEQRKKVGLMFKEEARKVGIEVNIVQQEANVFRSNLKTHNFDVCMDVWGFQPGPMDFKQIFYTTSALNKGSNVISFGDAKSDALIDSIRVELDETKRAKMIKRLQEIMHEQCGDIFLCAQQALIAVNKRYSNVYPSCNMPFFWEAGFDANARK